jgi:hypothetical protein
MALVTSRGSAALGVVALLVALLLPAVAWAAWGGESWGEMIWGGPVPSLPSLSVWGQIALAALLLAVPGRLLLRRLRDARSQARCSSVDCRRSEDRLRS